MNVVRMPSRHDLPAAAVEQFLKTAAVRLGSGTTALAIMSGISDHGE